MKYILSFCIAILFTSSLYSQNVNDQKFRLADTYEKSGDFENSARLYEELLKDSPSNKSYFDGLSRSLKSLNKYSELLPYSFDRYKKYQDIGNSVLYAELLWRTGKTKDANDVWDDAIGKYNVAETYAQISNSQVQLKLFDKAISVLVLGRKNLSNPNLFADELGKLYIAVGDYKNGTSEILNGLKINSNLALAQGRIYALIVDAEAQKYIQEQLKNFADNNSDNIMAQELYAWFLRTINRLDQALALYINIDRIKNANGSEVLRFAEDSRRDAQYDIALKAFATVIDKGKANPYFNSALYGYARTLEQKMQANKKMNKDDANEIIDRYTKIIKDFPLSQQAGESRLRIASIASTYLNDVPMAIEQLNLLLKEQANSTLAANAAIDLANIYINTDKFDMAEPILADLQTRFRSSMPSIVNNAKLLTAEIVFFKGLIDSALTLYSELTIVPETDIANKSLSRIVLIEQNKQYVQALVNYANAELFIRSNRMTKALEMLAETASKADGTNLAEIAIKSKAQIEFGLANYNQSLETMQALIKDYPDSIYSDFAYLLIGDNYSALGNKELAMQSYTDLLVKFPRSIYLNQVRQKIKTIR